MGAVRVVAILIDSVGKADSTFWDRYEELTPAADLIVYNGHAGPVPISVSSLAEVKGSGAVRHRFHERL